MNQKSMIFSKKNPIFPLTGLWLLPQLQPRRHVLPRDLLLRQGELPLPLRGRPRETQVLPSGGVLAALRESEANAAATCGSG